MALLRFIFSNPWIFLGSMAALLLLGIILTDVVSSIVKLLIRFKEVNNELQYMRFHVEKLEVENEQLREEIQKTKTA